jgi:hypothetical protein
MPTKEYYAKMTPEQKAEAKRKNDIYKKTPRGRMVYTIGSWKKRGMICDDYESVYQRYLASTNCECCGKEYNQNQMDKHMDHCHKTGKFRNVLCRNCNQLRGHIDKDYKLIMKLITMC